MSLHFLFPLAYPLPPLLHLLPTPAAARFYSPSRLSTSLVAPTSRRPINRHGLLSISRTYIKQVSHTKPTIEEVRKWDEDSLLEWIQQKLPKLLRGDDPKRLKEGRIDGVVLNHASDKKYFHEECNLPYWNQREARGSGEGDRKRGDRRYEEQQANNPTGLSKEDAEEAFKTGIKYTPPDCLLHTSGKNWTFQPHPKLYETLATNVLEHYIHYKRDEIDETYIPIYFYLGGAGTGKSRHGSEFASSVQTAITLCTEDPLYHELTQRLKTAFVFHVSFENGTPLTPEETRNPWNAVGPIRRRTDSVASNETWSGEGVKTQHSGTLNADAQLPHVILNSPSAPAGDIFFSVETRSPNGKGSQGKIVREVGQCKSTEKPLTQDLYEVEREKSAGPDDIFMLYTRTKISGDFVLPDRSGLVDESCWDSYFGPFAGRAYAAWKYSGLEINGEPRQAQLA